MWATIEEKKAMNLLKYINEDTVSFFQGGHKKEILNLLIDKAAELGFIEEKAAFTSAIEAREAKLSTGIGDGIAIPHAKSSGIKDFFVISAVLKEPISWDALDQKPVSLVFLIGGPEDKQTEYLQILAKLMGIVKNEEYRTAILSAETAVAVSQIFA